MAQLRVGMTRAQVVAVVRPPDRDRKDLMGALTESKTAYPVIYDAYLPRYPNGPPDPDPTEPQVIDVYYESADPGHRVVKYKLDTPCPG